MGAEVEGVAEWARAFQHVADELDHLDQLDAVAREAVTVMQGFMPVRHGGLRRDVQATTGDNNRAIVIAGNRIPYAGPINGGWRRRNISPSHFVERTDAVMDDRAVDILEAGWDDTATRNGLT